jgi:hypothetical protein
VNPSEPRDAEMRACGANRAAAGRRAFLKRAGAGSAAVAAASAAGLAADAPAPSAAALPRIRLGKHSVSRLICGDNPFKANSHLSAHLNRRMQRYYSPEQILKTLRRCEQVGINCWQASSIAELDLQRRLVDSGSAMQLIVIEATIDIIAKAKEVGALGVAHQGEATDHLFKSGQLDKVHDYLKRIRDAGMLAGVSTHMPAVVDAIESRGWDVDYYMTCVYERNRSREELEKVLGQAPIPVGEVYLPNDPPRMFDAVRRAKRTCLAFKILAAGRFSGHREWIDRAFRQAFGSIKPGDAVIVGMYDEYGDEPAENADWVRRYGA